MGLRRSLWIPLLGLLFFLIWLVVYSGNSQPIHKDLHDVTLNKNVEGGNFQVNTVDGKISLSDFKGNVVVLYFGSASCTDVCRTSLSYISLALQKLSQKERSRVKTLFISLDPERDSVEKLKEYVQYFHGSFIGATAEQEQLRKIIKQYGGSYSKVQTGEAGDYQIHHSAYIYVIDQKGDLKKSLPYGTDFKELADSIRKILKVDSGGA